MRRSFMNMNKIVLSLTLLVSARAFAVEATDVTTVVAPEVKVSWLTNVDNVVTPARVAVVNAAAKAWGVVPAGVKTGASSAMHWTSEKVQKYTPAFVSSAFGWTKAQLGKIKDAVPESVKNVVANPNVQFVAGSTIVAGIVAYAAYKIAKKVCSKDADADNQGNSDDAQDQAAA